MWIKDENAKSNKNHNVMSMDIKKRSNLQWEIIKLCLDLFFI